MNVWRLILTEISQQETLDGMVSMFDLLMLAMLFGSAVYGFYTAIRLHLGQYLFKNRFLYPANCTPENCTDVGGFIDYILPRLAIFSTVLLFLGGVFALDRFVLMWDNLWFDIGMVIFPVGAFVWYAIVQSKAARLFW